MTALYPGSFDPVTNGHIDMISRVLAFADVVVAVCHNPYKQRGMFTPSQRVQLILSALEDTDGFERVSVRECTGLLADFARECGASVVVRGIRSANEYEHDRPQALANRLLNPGLETIFLPSDPAHSFISSSIVKEIASFGGDIDSLVPKCVVTAMKSIAVSL